MVFGLIRDAIYARFVVAINFTIFCIKDSKKYNEWVTIQARDSEAKYQ